MTLTMPKRHPLVDFFASPQLALFLLALLALTSIIGTIIPQNAEPARYAAQYGPGWARFIALLDLDDMYNSWWFLGFLALFCVNLLTCSLVRLPGVLRLLRRDRLGATPEQLSRMPFQRELACELAPEEAAARLQNRLKSLGWPARERRRDDGSILIFAEKTPWARLGVYLTHASILVILAGAVLGSSGFGHKVLRQDNFAYKGYLSIPEGESTNTIQTLRGHRHVDLGFTIRLDRFRIAFYENGMPKTYASEVSILEPGQPPRQAVIEVNKPLKYRGVTFYQASYNPFPHYTVQLLKRPEQIRQQAIIPPAQEMAWPDGGIRYGIINRESQGEVTRRVKLWLTDGAGEPKMRWVDMNTDAVFDLGRGQYQLNVGQVFATGLQVAKDPGVGLVYGGCLLMLLGLYAAFFLAHREFFVLVQGEGTAPTSRILFAGRAQKNPVHFETQCNRLSDELAACAVPIQKIQN